jgi:agmatinase
MFIVKIPAVNGSNTHGCERAGNAVLNQLKKIYSNEKGIPIEFGNIDLEEIHIDNSNSEVTGRLIYENSLETFETKPKTVFLGGDHSISYSTAKAFLHYCAKQRKEPCLILFDAHADCLSADKKDKPNNRQWLCRLIEEGFSPKNVLIVGVRNISKEELVFLKRNNIRIIDLNQLLEDLHETCDFIMEFSSGKELYVSLDIDVVDPVFAPSTESPESGGLTSRQIIYLIQRISRIKTLRAADITEINSEKDSNGLTVGLGAKILAELI